jgi:hypothetical protein
MSELSDNLSVVSVARYVVDPRDPRAPSVEVWERLTPEERGVVLTSLPSEPEQAAPPEGDVHFRSKVRAREALEEYFRRVGRSVYVGSELAIYYPGAPMFAPDLIAVLDVEPHARERWVVSAEGRGIGFALEIHVAGSLRKDIEDNVVRFAALQIPEYFAFDAGRGRLSGWRLDGDRYASIVPQGGRWRSVVLDLDLAVEDGRLRFYHGSAQLLDATELIDRLSSLLDGALHRAEAEARRADEAAEEDGRMRERLRALGADPDGE